MNTTASPEQRIAELVTVAGRPIECRYCGETIYRIVHRGLPKRSDNTYPTGVYDADGANHWSTCRRSR